MAPTKQKRKKGSNNNNSHTSSKGECVNNISNDQKIATKSNLPSPDERQMNRPQTSINSTAHNADSESGSNGSVNHKKADFFFGSTSSHGSTTAANIQVTEKHSSVSSVNFDKLYKQDDTVDSLTDILYNPARQGTALGMPRDNSFYFGEIYGSNDKQEEDELFRELDSVTAHIKKSPSADGVTASPSNQAVSSNAVAADDTPKDAFDDKLAATLKHDEEEDGEERGHFKTWREIEDIIYSAADKPSSDTEFVETTGTDQLLQQPITEKRYATIDDIKVRRNSQPTSIPDINTFYDAACVLELDKFENSQSKNFSDPTQLPQSHGHGDEREARTYAEAIYLAETKNSNAAKSYAEVAESIVQSLCERLMHFSVVNAKRKAMLLCEALYDVVEAVFVLLWFAVLLLFPDSVIGALRWCVGVVLAPVRLVCNVTLQFAHFLFWFSYTAPMRALHGLMCTTSQLTLYLLVLLLNKSPGDHKVPKALNGHAPKH